MKRILSILLALAMLLTLCAGCGSSSSTTESSESETEESASTESAEEAEQESDSQEAQEDEEAAAEETETDAEAEETDAEAESEETETAAEETEAEEISLPIAEDPIVVTQWSGLHPLAAQYVTSSDDMYLYQQIAELTGITFDVTFVGANAEEEQFNLMIVGGEYTDIISGMDYYSSGISGAIEDGVIIDLYDYVTEYAPTYFEAISSDASAYTSLVTTEGKMGAMGKLYKEKGLEDNGLIIRGDWAEEFGLDEILTYDDLHDYVEAAYEQKGVTMTIPSDGQLTQLSQGFGVVAGTYSTYDGVVKSYVETDGYYDYLKLLNEWYTEGLIDPDFITRAGQSTLGDLFISGEASIGTAYASAMVGLNGIAEDPDALYIGVANPKQNADDEYTIAEPSPALSDDDTWSITCDCDEEKIPYLMKLVEYLFTDEGQLLYSYGTEGYTFEYDENGDPVFTELLTNNPDGYSFSVAEQIYSTVNMPGILDLRRDFYALTDVGYEALDLFASQNTGLNCIPSNIDAYLTTEESEEYASVSSDVETYMDATILQFITGDVELTEESYAEFVATCQDMGLTEMDELYQSAYDRYLETVESVE